ncbi:MAG: hypothetical protein ACW98Y_19880 [Candidatus Thorarchaeota archaeon]|jgi:hypothetical protein
MHTEDSLKHEAEKIIEDLDIMDYLNSYGVARIVGSVALDLIVKKDIDIHVHLKLRNPLAFAMDLSPILLDKSEVREVRVTDYSERSAIKVAIDDYPGLTGSWSIDFWLTSDLSTTGFDLTAKLNQTLTEEQRQAILNLKWHYHLQGLLRDGMSSRIYDSVVNNGVTTIDEFEKIFPINSDSK